MNAGDGLTPVLWVEDGAGKVGSDTEFGEGSVNLLAETGWRLDKADEDGTAGILSYGDVPV